jgi:hypothetical protein
MLAINGDETHDDEQDDHEIHKRDSPGPGPMREGEDLPPYPAPDDDEGEE